MTRACPAASRRSRIPSLALPLLLPLAAAALAGEPSGTASVWSSSGPGKVDDHRATASASGNSSSTICAQAIGSYAHTSGHAVTGAWDADVGLRAEAQSLTCYQLDVAHDAGDTATWSASGSIDWEGEASVETLVDATASASGNALLDFSGDLVLTGEAALAASSSTGVDEVTWEVSLTPSYKRRSTRTVQANEDSCSGGTHAISSGQGASVRVNVTSYAEGELLIDTNGLGFGAGTAELSATNRGYLMLSVTVVPGGTTGGDGPQTGPDAGDDGAGPTTPSGGPDGAVITPRWKRFKVIVDGPLPPTSEEGGVRISPDYPEQPKDVPGPGAPASGD